MRVNYLIVFSMENFMGAVYKLFFFLAGFIAQAFKPGVEGDNLRSFMVYGPLLESQHSGL